MPRGIRAFGGDNQPVYGHELNLHPSASRTGAGQAAGVDTLDFGTARLTLSVTAISGTTPSLTVFIETSGDGTTWQALGQFAARTTTGTERKTFPGLDRFTRARWTLTGTTPNATFTVAGDAV